jgi:hypothetical protein
MRDEAGKGIQSFPDSHAEEHLECPIHPVLIGNQEANKKVRQHC